MIVPSGTADGPIDGGRRRRQRDVGTQGAFSTTSFLVPPPDCVPADRHEHARTITFKLKKSGKASGVVSSTEDPAFTDCVAAVPVKIQRKKTGWRLEDRGKRRPPTDTGSYAKKIKDQARQVPGPCPEG